MSRRLVGALMVAAVLTAMPRLAAHAQLQMLEPWQTVGQEHEDRKNRLTRLSQLGGIEAPEFHDYAITPSEHGLKDYPTNIPVLRVVFREGVLFDFDRDEVKPEAAQVLNLIAASLRLEPPDVAVFIAGHTDAIGGVDYNLNLGMRRARAVARALALIGVNQAQLFAVSFGKAVPLAPNDTDAARAINRRVEFLFAARPEAAAAWLAHQSAMPCTDRRYAFAQECPTRLSFVAVSIAMRTPATHLNVDHPVGRVALQQSPSTVPLRNPAADVRVGERVVDIDLTQKVFHFRAPE